MKYKKTKKMMGLRLFKKVKKVVVTNEMVENANSFERLPPIEEKQTSKSFEPHQHISGWSEAKSSFLLVRGIVNANAIAKIVIP